VLSNLSAVAHVAAVLRCDAWPSAATKFAWRDSVHDALQEDEQCEQYLAEVAQEATKRLGIASQRSVLAALPADAAEHAQPTSQVTQKTAARGALQSGEENNLLVASEVPTQEWRRTKSQQAAAEQCFEAEGFVSRIPDSYTSETRSTQAEPAGPSAPACSPGRPETSEHERRTQDGGGDARHGDDSGAIGAERAAGSEARQPLAALNVTGDNAPRSAAPAAGCVVRAGASAGVQALLDGDSCVQATQVFDDYGCRAPESPAHTAGQLSHQRHDNLGTAEHDAPQKNPTPTHSVPETEVYAPRNVDAEVEVNSGAPRAEPAAQPPAHSAPHASASAERASQSGHGQPALRASLVVPDSVNGSPTRGGSLLLSCGTSDGAAEDMGVLATQLVPSTQLADAQAELARDASAPGTADAVGADAAQQEVLRTDEQGVATATDQPHAGVSDKRTNSDLAGAPVRAERSPATERTANGQQSPAAAAGEQADKLDQVQGSVRESSSPASNAELADNAALAIPLKPWPGTEQRVCLGTVCESPCESEEPTQPVPADAAAPAPAQPGPQHGTAQPPVPSAAAGMHKSAHAADASAGKGAAGLTAGVDQGSPGAARAAAELLAELQQRGQRRSQGVLVHDTASTLATQDGIEPIGEADAAIGEAAGVGSPLPSQHNEEVIGRTRAAPAHKNDVQPGARVERFEAAAQLVASARVAVLESQGPAGTVRDSDSDTEGAAVAAGGGCAGNGIAQAGNTDKDLLQKRAQGQAGAGLLAVAAAPSTWTVPETVSQHGQKGKAGDASQKVRCQLKRCAEALEGKARHGTTHILYRNVMVGSRLNTPCMCRAFSRQAAGLLRLPSSPQPWQPYHVPLPSHRLHLLCQLQPPPQLCPARVPIAPQQHRRSRCHCAAAAPPRRPSRQSSRHLHRPAAPLLLLLPSRQCLQGQHTPEAS
jgi:hypothetical protein